MAFRRRRRRTSCGFSSSTASAVSPRGWIAAGEALEQLTTPGRLPVAAYFDSLRQRLLELYGAPGAEAVLAASGTEAETGRALPRASPRRGAPSPTS
ncbi:MAG: hypothetical protein WDM85_03010 [Caulobacteraceae bacterium]